MSEQNRLEELITVIASMTEYNATLQEQLNALDASAQQTQKEFESRNDSILAYEDSYKTQSKKLQVNVTQTLDKVSKSAEQRLTSLVTDFTASLILKVTVVLGLVCLSLLLLPMLQPGSLPLVMQIFLKGEASTVT